MFIIINFIKKKVFIYLFSHVHLHVNLEKCRNFALMFMARWPFRRRIVSISPAYYLHFASIFPPFRRTTAAPTSSRYVMVYKQPLWYKSRNYIIALHISLTLLGISISPTHFSISPTYNIYKQLTKNFHLKQILYILLYIMSSSFRWCNNLHFA